MYMLNQENATFYTGDMTNGGFRFPNDRLSLDFLVTVGARGAGKNLEKLQTPVDLARWLFAASKLDVATAELTDADLLTARALREAIHRSVTSRQAQGAVDAADIALINRLAESPTPWLQLSSDGRTIERGASPGHAAAAALSAVARDAIELLGSSLLGRVRCCANPVCRALFLDLSRPGTRRWCSMGDGGCGNRAKTASIRERRRARNETGD